MALKTEHHILTLLWANQGTPITPVAIAAWTRTADTMIVLEALLGEGALQMKEDASGATALVLGPNETPETIKKRGDLNEQDLLVLQQLFEAAGFAPTSEPFRDEAQALGLTEAQAHFGGDAARMLALQRVRSGKGSDLIKPAVGAAVLGGLAARTLA